LLVVPAVAVAVGSSAGAGASETAWKQGAELTRTRSIVAVLGAAVLALGIGASEARPVGSDQVTINMIWPSSDASTLPVLIANFERVYPSISVNVAYVCLSGGGAFELTELAAGNGPDVICDFPGCGMEPALCDLAKAGNLAPLVDAPWVKRSLPLVTSLSKVGPVLYGFEKGPSPYGVFSNDALFKKLGLTVPRTFPELLSLCQKAKADGTVAFVLQGSSGVQTSWLISALAVSTVYAPNPRWTGQLKVGMTTFDGTPGWHQALQEFADMNQAGCFEPGVTGSASGATAFAQGQGLLYGAVSGFKASVDAAQPRFAYSFHPFPGGTKPSQTTTFLNLSPELSVNARSSAQNQAAARTFIDFVARPKQDALFTQQSGSLTEYEWLKGQIPSFMSGFGPVIGGHEYVINPAETWWNPSVNNVLEQDGIGLLTGQLAIDDVLNAMDAAWKQGSS
jgi:raffinose/stachyose/melibiose transport system substrate-binding protein